MFTGFIMSFLIALSELLERARMNFKSDRKKSFKLILISFLVFSFPFALEAYFSLNPELGIKIEKMKKKSNAFSLTTT